jgi:hypothetical protein
MQEQRVRRNGQEIAYTQVSPQAKEWFEQGMNSRIELDANVSIQLRT